MDKEQAIRIFKTLDASVLWKLGTIVFVAFLLTFAVQHSIQWLANKMIGRRRLFLLATLPFIRLLILIVSFSLCVASVIEPSIQNMVALLGSVGLALGFALKDYVSSLIGGVVALGEQNYRTGDWIRMGDVYGEVKHLGMRSIEILTPDDDRVLVPHNFLWNQAVFNSNNGEPRLQCVADFYVHPQHDPHLVRQTLEDVAITSPYLYFEEPVRIVAKNEAWATHYILRAYPVDSIQQFRFISDLTIRGKAALISLGVRFPTADCLQSVPEK